MPKRFIQKGDVLLIALPQNVPSGHEQVGVRPAIVVGLPNQLGKPRFPMLFVVPLTSQIGEWVTENAELYPHITAGSGGLIKDSIALLDHLRAVDETRIHAYIGTLPSKEFKPIFSSLLKIFS